MKFQCYFSNKSRNLCLVLLLLISMHPTVWPKSGPTPKAQLCGVLRVQWSMNRYQSPLWSFPAPSGLSLVSSLSLIDALLACSVSFGEQPTPGRWMQWCSLRFSKIWFCFLKPLKQASFFFISPNRRFSSVNPPKNLFELQIVTQPQQRLLIE